MTETELINLYSACPERVLDPVSREPITAARLAEVLPESLAEMELSDRLTIPVPEPLREIYAEFRPTPILRATRFAEAIGTDCSILVKDEGSTPSGNHKMNSAYWIAYHCARDGITTITTETTGNWGTALAMAGQRFGLRVVCFLDEASALARPDREQAMRAAGAEVIVVAPDDDEHYDPLVLSASRAVSYTREISSARYIFGSVYNYFILPQTMTGAEVRRDLVDEQPDVVVGSCGGGANLLGIAGAYLADALHGGPAPEVLCAESDQCPIVSKGVLGEYSIDDQDYYPRLRTYGLDRLLGDEYIGGLGSTIVAAPVAHFHEQGLLRTATFTTEQAAEAAELFRRTEGRRVALETGYQLAAVVAEARQSPGRRILVNVSSVSDRSYA
ncbi:pyridoxal-phosphate dependent enzyme [Micromonospora sp. NPDC049051]|uniref:pyridoxal-phosphate dependent enzyme n=1 Tax=unclassified Micromonospora TaxID=2617518 RepID=UPI0037187727